MNEEELRELGVSLHKPTPHQADDAPPQGPPPPPPPPPPSPRDPDE